MQLTTPDHTTLHYDETGSGDPPIIFVHGWTCHRGNWAGQVPHFAKSHRVVALDQRGHGKSDKPDQDYTIPGFVDDLAYVINELALHQPIVVGHSMGGVIALNLIRQHPDIARGIVFVDSTILPLAPETQALVGPLYAGLQSSAYAAVAEGFARMTFFNNQTDPALVEALLADICSAPQRLMHTAMASLLSEESMPAGPIPVPALYIRASQPSLADEAALKERYPGLEVVTVESAHFVQMEKPAETNSHIERLVATVKEGAPA